MRCLHFGSVRGDLQEDHVYDKRLCGYGSDANFLLPGANPCLPEHKIEVFVRFWGLEPSFSGISSTKSGFLCFFGFRDPHFRAF